MKYLLHNWIVGRVCAVIRWVWHEWEAWFNQSMLYRIYP